MVLTRKLQLVPCTEGMSKKEAKKEVDRVYKILRDGIYVQNKAYNIFISSRYTAIYLVLQKKNLQN